MLAFEGMSATGAVIDRLRAAPAAGFTLFRALNVESPAQVRALTTSLQEAAGGGLLIAADQEAGQFIALGDGTTSFAGNMARRRTVGGAIKAILTVVIGVVLLVGGIAIGSYVFQATRPAPTSPTGDPGVAAQDAPPAAKEFIAALAVNDADAIRSSLDQQPHIDLTNEMTKYGIQNIDSVDVLGTSVDGKRSATEILMHYVREDGIPFTINLVILVSDGKIEGFR